MPKFEWNKNGERWHRKVAAVATLEKDSELAAAYKGCGPYWAKIDFSGNVLALRSADDDAKWAEDDIGASEGKWELDKVNFTDDGHMEISCWGSCYEIGVDHESAVSAVLVAIGIPGSEDIITEDERKAILNQLENMCKVAKGELSLPRVDNRSRKMLVSDFCPKWLVGETEDMETWVTHLHEPRFTCKLRDDVFTEAEAELPEGSIYLFESGALGPFVWLDGQQPDPKVLNDLLEEAANFVVSMDDIAEDDND